MPIPDMTTWPGKTFTLALDLQAPVSGMDGDIVQIADRPCLLAFTEGANGTVLLRGGHAGGGWWVPYGPHRVTYADLNNNEWVASGPFSGCELAVGQHGVDVFVAHISRESASRTEARRAFEAWDTSAVWGRGQIRLPDDGETSACYVFVWGTNPAALQIRRVDVRLTSAGTNGVIVNVATIQLPPYTRGRSCPCCVIQ